MNNSFWDTVKGQQLADVLIVTLPKLVKEKSVKKTKQYIKQYKKDDMRPNYFVDVIQQEIDFGNNIIAITYDNDDAYIYVVYEKEE